MEDMMKEHYYNNTGREGKIFEVMQDKFRIPEKRVGPIE